MNSLTRLDATPRPESSAAPSVRIIDILRAYRRQLPIFLVVASLIFASAAAYTFSRPKRFTAKSAVLVAPRKAEVGSDRSLPMSDPTTDSSVDTQVEIIRSPTLTNQVVTQLHLDTGQQFARLTHTTSALHILSGGRLGKLQNEKVTGQSNRATAVDILTRNLDVRRIAQTFVLELSFSSSDPVLSAQIANAFANAYVQQSVDLKLNASGAASGLLNAQLAKARSDVNAADEALGRYKIQHNLMSVEGSTQAEQELTGLDQQVALARASEAETRARYETARQQLAQGSTGEDVGETLGSPVVQELRRQRAEVSRNLAELSTRYRSVYPAVTAANHQLSEVDKQIHAEVGRIISNLQAQADVAARRTASLQGSLNGARGALASTNVAGVGLNELQLKDNAARSLYEELLARVREISTQSATTQADARVTNIATPPTGPTSPNIPINLIVGALLAIVGGIGAVLLRQGLDQGIGTLDDVEGRLRLPYLAGLPTLSSSVNRARSDDPIAAVLDHRASAFAEGFRSLGASLLQSGATHPVKTIVLTSALPGEGKTTAAICLVRILAMAGRSAVLVDGDIRRPRVAERLGLTVGVGLEEVLEGRCELEDALVLDAASGAFFLPLAAAPRFESSPIEDGRIDALILQLQKRFDVILFDASPVLPVVDGRLLAKKADAVVLLVHWRKTPETAVEMAVHLLKTVGAETTGVALSQIDLKALARSGYGDPAQFIKFYGEYYSE